MKAWIGVSVLFAAFFWSLKASSSIATEESLFQKHPYEGLVKTASGKVPVPFHGYSMDPVIIQGLVDLEFAKEMLKDEDWVPVATRDGKALASFHFMQYNNCTLRSYKEIIFSLVTVQKPNSLTIDLTSDLTIGTLPVSNPATRFFDWKLWLDSQIAIDYGRELLGINKFSMKPLIWETKDTVRKYQIESKGKMLINVELTMNHGALSQLSFIPSAISAVGFKGLSVEETYLAVSNPKGVVKGLTYNVYLHFWFRGDSIFTTWDSSSFKMEFGEELKGWQFTPKYIQWIPNERFVVDFAPGIPVTIEPFDPEWESKANWN